VMTDEALRNQVRRGALALSRQFQWSAIAVRHLEMYRGLGVS